MQQPFRPSSGGMIALSPLSAPLNPLKCLIFSLGFAAWLRQECLI
jgi:hypothetical protein